MNQDIDLDNHLRKCITTITSCILLVGLALASIIYTIPQSPNRAESNNLDQKNSILANFN